MIYFRRIKLVIYFYLLSSLPNIILSGSDPDIYKASRIIRVGINEQIKTPSTAAQIANQGDTIVIQSGVYENDAAVWQANNLTIRGINGVAHLKANGTNAEGKAIWVIKGENTTIENIEFSGAKVPDGNGSGIRHEGKFLTIRNCFFHGNENGLLSSNNPAAEVLIENSEFAYNGTGDGLTHNIYIGKIKKFSIKFSYVHHTKIGNNIKSRAANNFIQYNRIMDEKDGNSSYAIDLSNGGLSFIIGNVIQQGRNTDNSIIISYGAEGLSQQQNEVYVINNTIVNDRHYGVFLRTNNETNKAIFANNLLIGPGDISQGFVEKITNLHISAISGLRSFFSEDPQFYDISKYDYRIKSGSTAIDKGSILQPAHGVDLIPKWSYEHPSRKTERIIINNPDLGAYEFIK